MAADEEGEREIMSGAETQRRKKKGETEMDRSIENQVVQNMHYTQRELYILIVTLDTHPRNETGLLCVVYKIQNTICIIFVSYYSNPNIIPRLHHQSDHHTYRLHRAFVGYGF